MNAEEFLIAGRTEGSGFVIEMYHMDCGRWWPVFSGEGVAPRLAVLILAASNHRCGDAL